MEDQQIENNNQKENLGLVSQYFDISNNYKQIFVWVAIFLFFILFLFTELFYFYPGELKGNEKSLNNALIKKSSLAEENFLNQNNLIITPSLDIKAKSAIIADTKIKQILYQKDIYKKMPIASLTKLMTAIVILENFNLDSSIKISEEAILTEGDAGNFVVGENISIRSLLYALLIASSNDAAIAIAENTPNKFVFRILGPVDSNLITPEQRIKAFVALMNKKAQELNLNSTYFSDPAGLLEQTQSTAYDLMNLSFYILEKYPIIFEITKIKEMTITSIDNLFIHKLVNTDKLLENMDNIIIGGKTGYLDEAGQCLLVLIKINDKIFTNIILNSPDRFKEMQQLIELIKTKN